MINDHITPANLRQTILSSAELNRSQKDRLIKILDGELLAPLTSDIMSKHLFSPDNEPERFDFIMQRVMKDPTIHTLHSATNEIPVEFIDSKRTISDLSSWLTDNRYANLEIQAIAHEFSFNRFDIYTSRMLLLQYSAPSGQKKSDISPGDINGVVFVVLMRNSPPSLKDSKSTRYIHRFVESVSDSGVKLPLLRKVAFVQLDKALEQFLDKTYNEDEDYELLVELAMLADANNATVKEAAMGFDSYRDIYDDAVKFSLDIDTQLRILSEEFSASTYEYDIYMAEQRAGAKGEAKGRAEGEARINSLYSWLHNNGRDNDVWAAMSDPEYRARLLREYDESGNH